MYPPEPSGFAASESMSKKEIVKCGSTTGRLHAATSQAEKSAVHRLPDWPDPPHKSEWA